MNNYDILCICVLNNQSNKITETLDSLAYQLSKTPHCIGKNLKTVWVPWA